MDQLTYHVLKNIAEEINTSWANFEQGEIEDLIGQFESYYAHKS
jgi:hypothetical protein